jgi:MYXO-CTERM domain-containing protein
MLTFKTTVARIVCGLPRALAFALVGLALACSPGRDETPSQGTASPAIEPRDDALAGAPAAFASSLGDRIAAGEYRFRAGERGFHAVNRKHDLRVELDGNSARVAARGARAGDQFSIELSLVGRGKKLRAAASVPPVLGTCTADGRLDEEGNCLRRAELRRADLTEWWENREEGLEQGFTIPKQEAGSGPLRLELSIRGARVTLDPGSSDAVLETRAGLRLRYGGLHAFDADGRTVPARFKVHPHGLAIEVDDQGARYPLVVDPILSTVAHTAESDQGLAGFGISTTGAGDVNGDGYGDVVVGAWAYDNGQTDEGRAYLYLGSANGLGAAPAWTAEVNQDGAGFGRAVAGAGDVNGDGYSDVIVGAPNYGNGQSQEGAVFLYLGSAGGLLASPSWTGESNQMGAQLGMSLASAGDVNRDGRADIIVGAPYFDEGQLDEGAAMLYLGTASGLASSAAWTGQSDQAGAYYGTSVSGAGDINRDGYADIVVGAPYFDNGNTDEGRAYSYHGSALGPVPTAWNPEGAQDSAYLGSSIAVAGDINGDGYADVVAGTPGFTNVQAAEGRATAYHGSPMGLSATPNWTFESNQANASTGAAVASLGDTNGDGFADVIVGSPNYDNGQTNEGLAHFFIGSNIGLRSAVVNAHEGEQGSAAFGSAVASAGDVNGDGFGDVLVGAPNYDNMQADEGRIFVYYGSGGIPNYINQTYTMSGSVDVADGGDVNGDGFGDVLVSQTSVGTPQVFLGSDAGLTGPSSWSFTVNSDFVPAGDVNGDGYADALVTSPGYANGETDEGKVWLFHGSPGGLGTAPSWTVEGNQTGALLGSAVSSGDANGDGYSDVLVGIRNYTNGETNEGRAELYLGSPAGLDTTADWTGEINVASSRFGQHLAMGDIDRDGFSDLVVSATFIRQAFVYRGSATAISTTPHQTLSSAQGGWGEVQYAGDVNGDGYGDFILRDSGLNYLHLGSAAGLSTTSVWSLSRVTGAHVAAGGDVNGDGRADLLISNSTSSFAFLGTPTGLTTGSQWGVAYAGFSLASPDVNGDGFSDPVIGSSTSFRSYFGSSQEITPSAYALAPLARRAGTTTPIAPYGIAPTGAFDARLLGRTPFGRGKLKIQVEVEPLGSPFDGLGVVSGSAWTDTGAAGIDLQLGVSGLGENAAYHYRSRLLHDPSLGFPQGWSHWIYGGNLGERLGVHLRTSCAAGDSDGDGTPNCNDGCPNNPNKIAPGVCGCATADTDSDGDGTPNCNDGCPNDPNKIAPGGCGCGTADTDSDGDGTPNCNDLCPNNAPKTAPGVCGCATPDTDSDGDGTPNCNDLCPNNAPKTSPGVCGCATPDTDSDGDGTPNCNDGCPNNPQKTSPGVCGCSAPDTDTDGDGAADCAELCDNDPNKTAPGVCGCGTPDADGDGDGTLNCQDGCPTDPNKIQAGVCGCSIADTDGDGDGTPNCTDGCPMNPLKTSPGACGCSAPETDTDGDGTPNCIDTCPNDPNKIVPGNCGCGVADADADGDGTLNCNDGCPNDPNKTAPGVCGCGTSDANTDGDSAPDCNDGCPNDPNKISTGVCGCGTPDTDTDSDGTANCNDGCPTDPTKIAAGACGCGASDADSDGDGTPNCTDGCPSDPNKTAAGTCGCGQPEVTNCGDACPNDPNKTSPGLCGCGTPDTDTDSDGTPNCNDGCPTDPGKTAAGVCGCGDADTDGDGDGTPNCTDGCPSDGGKVQPGVCGCGTPDTDTDSDGTPNCNDDCPTDPLKAVPGSCGCGVADTDADGDATPDCADACPSDASKIAPDVCGCGVADTDGDSDGVPDCHDDCPSTNASTANGCPDGPGTGGQGGEGGDGGDGGTGGSAGSGADAGAGADAGTGGQGDGGEPSGGQGNAGESGAGGDAGRAGAAGQGGSVAGSGGASAGSGKPPRGGDADEDSGCGCRVPGGAPDGTDSGRALALLLLGAFLRRRRRAA